MKKFVIAVFLGLFAVSAAPLLAATKVVRHRHRHTVVMRHHHHIIVHHGTKHP